MCGRMSRHPWPQPSKPVVSPLWAQQLKLSLDGQASPGEQNRPGFRIAGLGEARRADVLAATPLSLFLWPPMSHTRILLFLGCATWLVGSYFPVQGSNSEPDSESTESSPVDEWGFPTNAAFFIFAWESFPAVGVSAPVPELKPTWSMMETPGASESFLCSRGCGWMASGLT